MFPDGEIFPLWLREARNREKPVFGHSEPSSIIASV